MSVCWLFKNKCNIFLGMVKIMEIVVRKVAFRGQTAAISSMLFLNTNFFLLFLVNSDEKATLGKYFSLLVFWVSYL